MLALFSRRTASNSLQFLELVIEEFPFPIQRIQTDRGREFFAYSFQEKLMEYGIKFRPVKPASPPLNGKVARSQRTDLEEFYPTVDLKAPDLSTRLQDWQDHYNQYRPHGSLGSRTPWQVWHERAKITPILEEVEAKYDRAGNCRRPTEPSHVDRKSMHTTRRAETREETSGDKTLNTPTSQPTQSHRHRHCPGLLPITTL